jgi:hypothetical protein
VWLRIGTAGELGNYQVAAQLVAFRVVLSSTELVGQTVYGKDDYVELGQIKIV